jgi:GrpB-like predicted nucleotidyltransferase (UPF0157 family)
MDCNLRAKLNRNELFDENISQVSDFRRCSKNVRNRSHQKLMQSFPPMQSDDSLAKAISEEISISAYDSRWAEEFAAERDRLMDLLPGRFAAIEHVGSTAVLRLSAKPIIDILAGVPSLCEADALLDFLCVHGYVTSAEFNATLPDRRWLMRHANGKRTHHLHLVVHGGRQWIQHLKFRDMLRTDALIQNRYEQLKQELAERHRHDREAYTSAKAAFIDEILTGDIES